MNEPSSSIMRMATIVVVALACIWTALNASDAWRNAHRRATQPFRIMPGWSVTASEGHRIGAPSAVLQIAEFSDYQCPVCATLWKRTAALLRKYPSSVAAAIHELPLRSHPMAFPAAIASECAARFGRFRVYHELLFAHSSALPSYSLSLAAVESGISDTNGFDECLRDATIRRIVQVDADAGARFAATGTPVIVIGSEVYDGLPWDFEAIVERHLSNGR